MTAREFTDRLAHLLRREHGALADFLLALAEFDRERLWAELGYANLFDFLHRRLGLSRGAAHYRKTAAALVQRYPGILAPIRDGRLCITTIIEVARVITPENQRDVVPKFYGCSKREAMAIAAAINPVEGAPRRDMVTTQRTDRAQARIAGALTPALGPLLTPGLGPVLTPALGPVLTPALGPLL